MAVLVISSGGGAGVLSAGVGAGGTGIGGCGGGIGVVARKAAGTRVGRCGQGLGIVATIEAMGFTAFCPSYVLLVLIAWERYLASRS